MRSRLAAIDEALRKNMPEGTRWTRPEGGMCLWLELPLGFDASELLIHAKERGVLFAPGRYFYVQSPQPNTLRLSYAALDEKTNCARRGHFGGIVEGRDAQAATWRAPGGK